MRILRAEQGLPKFSDEPEDIHVLDDPEYRGKYILEGPVVTGGRLSRMTTPSEERLVEQIEAQKAASSLVYFIQAGLDGPIKIGHSRNVTKRLRKLQMSSPVQLRLIHVEPGGELRERELHEQFATARTHGEWFNAVADLYAYLNIKSESFK